jgi:hypothetical protein
MDHLLHGQPESTGSHWGLCPVTLALFALLHPSLWPLERSEDLLAVCSFCEPFVWLLAHSCVETALREPSATSHHCTLHTCNQAGRSHLNSL